MQLINQSLLSDLDDAIKKKSYTKSFTEKATENAEEFRTNVTGSKDLFRDLFDSKSEEIKVVKPSIKQK